MAVASKHSANRQAAGDVFAELAEGVAACLAKRPERRPAITALRRVPANRFVQVVIDRAEEPDHPSRFV